MSTHRVKKARMTLAGLHALGFDESRKRFNDFTVGCVADDRSRK